MSAFYKIDKERGLVMSSGSGVLTKEDIIGHMDRPLKDPDFDPNLSQLSDFTQCTALEIGPEDIRLFAKRSIFSPRSRRPFVVKNDVQFGLARMFQIHRELNGETGIGVFRSLDEALGWIFAKDAVS